ncbi:hypothetical protein CBR_g9040 [Chara braunii]|uniref:Pectinesterase n=1 Tax=Chara braunii TaxID=69332 RepID=A0A388KNK2_CHABU|nr:hypothetical protein CBR_g9040 [Chara braunii]|eukprot:GBG71624.1 hypothetical protein CBR_g9040 [Chara braunii]
MAAAESCSAMMLVATLLLALYACELAPSVNARTGSHMRPLDSLHFFRRELKTHRERMERVLVEVTEPPPGGPARTITVALDGSGDYKLPSEAVASLGTKSSAPVTIYIKDGVYRDRFNVVKRRWNVTMIGNPEDPSRVVIVDNRHAGKMGADGDDIGTFQSATATFGGYHIIVQGISFINDFPRGKPGEIGNQAVAMRASGWFIIFANCIFRGFQDTLYAHKGVQLYKNCYIEGTIDFIFGYATAQYEDCHIHTLADPFTISAEKRQLPGARTSGFLFLRGIITGVSGKAYLGRAWGAASLTWFVETQMEAFIQPAGWNNFNDPTREKTADYGEYNCSGPGSDRSGRVSWSRALTLEEVGPFLGGDRQWIDGNSWVRLPSPLPPTPDGREDAATTPLPISSGSPPPPPPPPPPASVVPPTPPSVEPPVLPSGFATAGLEPAAASGNATGVIAALRADPRFSIFVGLLDKGFAANLPLQPLTISVPENAAFARLGPGQLDTIKADEALLYEFLGYHFADGFYPKADLLAAIAKSTSGTVSVPTQGGSYVSFSSVGDVIKVDGSTSVTEADFLVDSPNKAVAHVIASVLLSQDVTDSLASSSSPPPHPV